MPSGPPGTVSLLCSLALVMPALAGLVTGQLGGFALFACGALFLYAWGTWLNRTGGRRN